MVIRGEGSRIRTHDLSSHVTKATFKVPDRRAYHCTIRPLKKTERVCVSERDEDEDSQDKDGDEGGNREGERLKMISKRAETI